MKIRTLHSKASLAFWGSLLALAVATSSSNAALVVDLKFVTGAGSGAATTRTDPDATVNNYTIDWSDSEYLVDASADGQNKAFYGAYSATSATDITSTPTIKSNDGTTDSGDRFIFQGGKSGDGDQAARILALWDNDDFLASGFTQFDASAGSSLTLGIHTYANSGGGMGTRFVIRDGTQFYISSFSTSALGSASINGTTAGLEWGSFNVNDFASFDNSETDLGMSVTFSAQTFSNVTGVGFLTEIARPLANGPVLAVNDFQAALVPEPSIFALLSGVFAMGWIMLRRRR